MMRKIRYGASLMVVLLLSIILSSTAQQNDDFVNENISRKMNLANPHGLENILAFKVAKKNAAATMYTVPLLPESKAGRLAKVSCTVNNELVKDLKVEKGADSKIHVPVPATFTSGSIACQT